jgi:hypothetical protein
MTTVPFLQKNITRYALGDVHLTPTQSKIRDLSERRNIMLRINAHGLKIDMPQKSRAISLSDEPLRRSSVAHDETTVDSELGDSSQVV